MTSDSKETANRKLRWLWASLIMYLLFMFVALNYALKVPYQILAVGGVLNTAILFTFILTIRRLYLRSRGRVDLKSSETREVTSSRSLESDRRSIRWLWIGAGVAFLTCINAIAYVRELPYKATVGIVILYAGIAIAFVLEIRRVYHRLRQ